MNDSKILSKILASSTIDLSSLNKKASYDPSKEWIGFDLDGTLAKYTTWKGPDHIGEPIKRMVSRVKSLLNDGKTVKIFTARASGDSIVARRAIKAWCKEHLGQELPITCKKDMHCTKIYDDRAAAVQKNTGRVKTNLQKIAAKISKSTLYVPENFDIVTDIKAPKGFEIWAGGNDWEADYTTIAITDTKDYKDGTVNRIWVVLKDLSELPESEKEHIRMKAHTDAAKKFLRRWLKEFATMGERDLSDLEALAEALKHKDLDDKVEKKGHDQKGYKRADKSIFNKEAMHQALTQHMNKKAAMNKTAKRGVNMFDVLKKRRDPDGLGDPDLDAALAEASEGPGRFITEDEVLEAAQRAVKEGGFKDAKEALEDHLRKQEETFRKEAGIEEARKKTNCNPTDKQIEAENYAKGKFSWKGLRIALENPKGSTRSGVDGDGTAWSITMKYDYGYFLGTTGKDGDHIDTFIGPNLDSEIVYIVDQVACWGDGRFDEHKCVIGASSKEEAKKIYLSNYQKGWKGIGAISGKSLDDFKKWIGTGTRKMGPICLHKKASSNVSLLGMMQELIDG